MDTDDKQLYSSEFENELPKKSSKKTSAATQVDNFLVPKNQSQPGSGVVYEEQQIPSSSLLKDTVHDASITKTFSSTLSNTEASENLGENPLELLLLSLEARLEPPPECESYIQELALLKNSSEQHVALVYLISNMTNKLDRLLESISISKNTGFSKGQSDTHHLFIGAHNFVWTKPPKDYIRIMLHQLFVSSEVESYTRGTDSDSQVIGNVQSGNPEQPIPRLIELAKMVLS
ncbi:hypothetical protein BY996DRAFT_6409248 [Phakopsora pachyrhizi]|nr:hypothetical protein BY996DRAFT_6409248 [Phakopsora pachyrhizi]